MSSIKNGTSRMMNANTLNGILRQLRKLKGMNVDRNNSAGTVVCKSTKGQEYLRGLKTPSGTWIVRYDSRLLQEK